MSTSSGGASVGVLDVRDIDALLAFADTSLPGLRLPNGIFCFDREWSSPALRGESVRYSIMVLLGVARRAQSGGSTSIDAHGLHRQIHERRAELGVGDLGLLLWADVRMGDTTSAKNTLIDLARKSSADGALASLEGMEAAWFVLGAVEAQSAGLPAADVLKTALTHFRSRQSPRSPLFRHYGQGRGRTNLPNFATQVYSLLALAEAARHDVEPGALSRAVRLADLLIELRGDDSGWPWLFHADHGVVVERYEIYSVHQDAMAPMAFFALSEVTGDQTYSSEAVAGLPWCYGVNEMGFRFYDEALNFAHRSIRRSGMASRANLYANTALGLGFGAKPRVDVGGVEINTTCRPYHLGWILEAWSGRDSIRPLAESL